MQLRQEQYMLALLAQKVLTLRQKMVEASMSTTTTIHVLPTMVVGTTTQRHYQLPTFLQIAHGIRVQTIRMVLMSLGDQPGGTKQEYGTMNSTTHGAYSSLLISQVIHTTTGMWITFMPQVDIFTI
jgi:hypothetical protein